MDLQEYLAKVTTATRKRRMEESDQLTLGGLIDKLTEIAADQRCIVERYKSEATIEFDFADLHPTVLESWRGSYEELALDFAYEGDAPTITAFLTMLNEAVGKTFTGWKGGDYVMDRDTPIWVSRPERGSHTAVVDVVDNEYCVYLITAIREF